MTKKTVIVFLSLMLGIASKGYNASDISKQIIREVEPISPQADVLKKFGEYPMDYSTGVPSISIPLYEIKVGSYTLPISISYHASGIKVQDVSSPIGLGWTLIAGGSIIRQIKGAVDKGTLVLKSEADVISNFNRGVFTSEGCAYLAAEHRLDTESDSYSYQITRIDDSVNDPTYNGVFNFVDGTSQANEYTYDKNGNLTKDLNKKISLIQYNLLNLPTSIAYSNGKSATYIYDANGNKLKTTYRTSGSTTETSTDYCGNMIYENNVLKQILIDGGYITFNGSTPQYHYYLKDHLGNNRVVCSASGAVEQVNHYYPFGGLFGESTGGDTQRYKYNGKELDRMHGLDWYDYGARHMDGMRFTTIDPLAGDYYSISPYAYCANNPINAIDPDGRAANLITGGIGALVGGGIYAYMAYCEGKSTQEIWGAATEGAIVGGVTGLTLGASTAITGWSMAGNMAAGALSSGAGSTVNQIISHGEINTNDIVKSTVTGAVSGAMGAMGGKVVNKSGEKAINAITAKAENTVANARNIAYSRVEQTGAEMGGKYAKQQVNREAGNIIREAKSSASSATRATKKITTGKNWSVQMGIGEITNKASDYYDSVKKTLKSIYNSIF